MAILTREAILTVKDIKTETLEVPEWGGSVIIRVMLAGERDMYEDSCQDQSGENTKIIMRDIRAKLCALTIVDEKGKRLFSDADIKELSKKSATAIDTIFTVARKLNKITDKEMDKLAKN